MKKKIWIAAIFISVTGITAFVLWNNYGIFSEFNYFSARGDIKEGDPVLVSAGMPRHCARQGQIDSVTKSYGFRDYNLGCVVSNRESNGIRIYNNTVDDYLDERNGKGWRDKYYKTIDSLYELAEIERKREIFGPGFNDQLPADSTKP